MKYLIETTKRPNPKSEYEVRFSFNDGEKGRAIMYYKGINIGLGYRKRFVEVKGGKRKVLAKEYS